MSLAGRLGASGAEALLHTSGNTVNGVLPESPWLIFYTIPAEVVHFQ
jgi:hypothetical protein